MMNAFLAATADPGFSRQYLPESGRIILAVVICRNAGAGGAWAGGQCVVCGWQLSAKYAQSLRCKSEKR
jgi:hypothetical protein